MKKCFTESRKKVTSYIQLREKRANWIGQILRRNCLLKRVFEKKKGRRKDISDGKMGKNTSTATG